MNGLNKMLVVWYFDVNESKEYVYLRSILRVYKNWLKLFFFFWEKIEN